MPAPGSAPLLTTLAGAAGELRGGARRLARRAPRPELALLLGLAAILNLWALSRNGWANDYYSAAVRSMSSSWHDFLYASLDRTGVMTVDKPPLSLWVQALSVRAFGYHPLSVLVPQALMGVASVALVYDLVRRVFGRLAGFAAGLALATTPVMVAVSRHNNPDAMLVLCSVAAVWFAVRALEPEADHRLRKLMSAGVCVGLGFETKMGVALVVVPGIAAAWMLVAPADGASGRARARLRALWQLLCAGSAMVVVGGAWPALVELTPAGSRPWVSGTGDNRVTSLIFGYNGLGRVDGQSGGPGGAAGAGPFGRRGAGGGGTMFGEAPGAFRLLNTALGGQAGWLLGLAVAGGLAVLVSSRLRPSDPRTGWLVAVGGAFVTAAVLFSGASGIFHPYYVSLLAPFAAALVGAGVAELRRPAMSARLLAPFAVSAAVAVELVVRARYPGQLPWLPAVLIGVAMPAAVALALARRPALRTAALLAATGALLLAPSVWAFDTLGYATSGTFPEGGPQSAQIGGAPFAGAGAFAVGPKVAGGPAPGAPSGARQGRRPVAGPSGPGAAASGPGAFGGPFGSGAALTGVLSYVNAHGGGTIAVASQSSAAAAIIQKGAAVAGIGGFSGRESDVSAAWLAQQVRSGKIRWVLVEAMGGLAALPGDTRAGATAAMSAAAKACTSVVATGGAIGSGSAGSAGAGSGAGAGAGFGAGAGPGGTGSATLYDCRGHASALAAAA